MSSLIHLSLYYIFIDDLLNSLSFNGTIYSLSKFNFMGNVVLRFQVTYFITTMITTRLLVDSVDATFIRREGAGLQSLHLNCTLYGAISIA